MLLGIYSTLSYPFLEKAFLRYMEGEIFLKLLLKIEADNFGFSLNVLVNFHHEAQVDKEY